MRIFIPTRGRIDRQITMRDAFLDHIKAMYPVFYVVPDCDYKQWNTGRHHVLRVSDDFKFSDIRQYIAEYEVWKDPYHVCIDDDLTFFCRQDPECIDLFKASQDDIENMFRWMELQMITQKFAHGGISAREGNNHVEDDYATNTRCMRCHFYDARVIKGEELKYTDVAARQDFHMTLSLLERGYPNIVSYVFAQNQMGGSDTPGGCSRYRTPEFLEATAKRLQELHPEFVKVVEKETKTSWGGGKRIDVQMAWKKAYRSKMDWRKLSMYLPKEE